MKASKLKIETFAIKDWNDPVSGVILEENKDWILLNEIPTDYEVDGFAILNKKFITERISKKFEKKNALVLSLKKYSKPKVKIKLSSLKSILKAIEKKYEIFQFQDQLENSVEIGVLDEIENDALHLIYLKANGKFDKKYTYEYDVNDIRKINFDTNYLNSLKLLVKHSYKK